ncbi:hypothetical protein GW17_00008748 [Ensete ventricosum]|nr:hypothetical protein GW17_00008748 [Ensete ventricosum]
MCSCCIFVAKAVRRRGGQPPCRAGHPRPYRSQGPMQGGGWLRPGQARKGGQRHPQGAAASSLRAEAPPTKVAAAVGATAACSAVPAKGAGCRVPAWGCRTRSALPLARAAVPAIGVAAPWQGDC